MDFIVAEAAINLVGCLSCINDVVSSKAIYIMSLLLAETSLVSGVEVVVIVSADAVPVTMT